MPDSVSTFLKKAAMWELNAVQRAQLAELRGLVSTVRRETTRRDELVKRHLAVLDEMQAAQSAGNATKAGNLGHQEELLVTRMQQISGENQENLRQAYELVASLPSSELVDEVLAQLP